MGWIKETFQGLDNSKDPFVKYIFRLILLVVFIVISFLAYKLITGNKIIWNNGLSVSADSSNIKQASVTKPLPIVKDTVNHRSQKSDTVTTVIPSPKRNKPKSKVGGSIDSAVEIDPGELTDIDKHEIQKMIVDLIGGESVLNPITVAIFHHNDDNSSKCAYQLKRHLNSLGFAVIAVEAVPKQILPPGFTLSFQSRPQPGSTNLVVEIGSLVGKRMYRMR